MRLGQNPAKFVKDVAKPQRITVAVLTYIPFLSGFYAETLDVLKICLESIWAGTTDVPYDLMVFDNGSCAEVTDYLKAQKETGKIQYLILSEKNLGKGGAWNIMLAGAPGEIIAYADSDVLFYPGWLSQSVKILETYPKVGMVTSRPFRTMEQLMTSTIDWARKEPEAQYQNGSFLSWEDFSSFNTSLGTSEEQSREWFNTTTDHRVNFHGVPAQIGASHWQFVAYKSVLQQFLPFDMSRPMGQVRQLDQRMNDAGYLRLMTAEPYAQNMSNQVPTQLRKDQKVLQPVKNGGFKKKFFNFAPVRKVLMTIYDAIFNVYYR